MAAHVLTALREMSEHPMSMQAIQAGLGYALFGDQLSTVDWSALNYLQSPESAREIATGLIPKYQAIWEYLGKPETAEEWNNAWFTLKGKARQHYWDLVFGKVQS